MYVFVLAAFDGTPEISFDPLKPTLNRHRLVGGGFCTFCIHSRILFGITETKNGDSRAMDLGASVVEA